MHRAMARLREKAPSDEPGEAGASSGASPLVLGDSWGYRKLRSRGAVAPPGILDPSSSAPLTSTHMVCELTRQGLQGALPPARHQVMKPGLRWLASINSVMKRSWHVELEEEAQVQALLSLKVCQKSSVARKIGRPRRPRTPLEQAAEVANLHAPRLWNPVQSLRGLSPAEVDAANSLLKFSYHTASLSEMVLELRTIR
jgi:hypothetical protein